MTRRGLVSTALLAGALHISTPVTFAQAKKAQPPEATAADRNHAPEPKVLAPGERVEFLRRAQLWTPSDVASKDLRLGPQGPGSFKPNEPVTCDYTGEHLSGASPKFECITPSGDRLKVKYGATNGEVQGSVLGSRLLWALGFGADREYPVRVTCRGCSANPQSSPAKVSGEQEFELAVVERKHAGDEVTVHGKTSGWGFDELALVDETKGGASRAQRDALTLLAIFMQHTDSKPEQQRLMCLPGGAKNGGYCAKPFLTLHDVGLTFGHGTYSNAARQSSVNFEAWSATPVWKDAVACVGHLSKSHTGSLGEPVISEAGRAFLARQLSQLTDAQLHDLFEVARVERRSRRPDDEKVTTSASVDEWVAAFKQKREQIVAHRCPE